ncbi:MAG: RDD family protein [Nitrospinae bacterium]|nr:RDD family protein [Nitrospinota bacterium]
MKGAACVRCGMVNMPPSGGDKCAVCQTPLKERPEDPFAGKMFGLELNRTPLKKLAGRKLAQLGKFKGTAEFVSVAANIITAKLLRRIALEPLFCGRLIRFRKTDLTEETAIDQAALKSVTSKLKERGFAAAWDRIVESRVPPVYERIYINPEKKLYASAGLVENTLGAGARIISPKKEAGLVIVSNEPAQIAADPESEFHCVPGGSIPELLNKMERLIEGKDRTNVRFSARDILIDLADSHERAFDDAVSKKLLIKFRVEGEENPGASAFTPPAACHFHHNETAVKHCSLCDKPVCVACLFRFEEKDYCKLCLPGEAEKGIGTHLDLTGELNPAGMALRGAVKVLEIAGLLWLLAAMFPEGAAGSKIAFFILASAMFTAYFFATVAVWGATPLQLAAGVAVIDAETGAPPGFKGAFIRTCYLFVTMITFIPAIGYIAAIRDPLRRGWHDRMAGTLAVTSNAPMKEKAGLAAIVLMAAIAGLNWTHLKGGAADIFTVAFGGSAPLDMAVSATPYWSGKTATPPAMPPGRAAVVAEDGIATAYMPDNGRQIWASPARNVERVFADTFSSNYIFTAGKNIGAIAGQNGAVAWSTALPAKPETPPAFNSTGITIAAGGNVISLDRAGKFMWSKKADGPVERLSATAETVTAVIKGQGSTVYRQNDGQVLVKMPGMRPVASTSAVETVFGGAAGTALVNMKDGSVKWAISRRLIFPVEDMSGQPYLYSATAALRPESGISAFGYPKGCAFTGTLKNLLILNCPSSKKMIIADGKTGASIFNMGAPPFGKSWLLAETGRYAMLAEDSSAGGFVKMYLLMVDPGLVGAQTIPLGDFSGEPSIHYDRRANALFIAGKNFMGAWRPPF